MAIPVIVYGNPCDGITMIGPFKSLDDAVKWAEDNLEETNGNFFWPAPVLSPSEFLGEGKDS
jgi:hypothetical protein